MPAPLAILRIAKVKDLGTLAAVSRHHERTRPTPNADPRGTVRALVGGGVPEAEAAALLASLPKRPRKGAVLAIEVVMTASPKYFRPDDPTAHGTHDPARTDAWAGASVAWLQDHFGSGNVAAATLHLDEATPHIHAIVVPIDRTSGKRARGPRLNAAHWLDGAARLSAMQDSYANAVEALGIERGQRGSTATHQQVRRWYAVAGRAACRAMQAREQAEALVAGLHAVAEGRVHAREDHTEAGRCRRRIAIDGMPPDQLARLARAPTGRLLWSLTHRIAQAAEAEAGRAREAAVAAVEDQVRQARDWCRTVLARSRDLGTALDARERAAVLDLAMLMNREPHPRQQPQRQR